MIDTSVMLSGLGIKWIKMDQEGKKIKIMNKNT